MAETIETAYANCTSTTPVAIIDGAASTTYIILSLMFCQTGAEATFSLYRTDAGGSTNKTYIYKNVLMTSHKTFEHVDKLVLEASQELYFEASTDTNLDCVATFIKQAPPSDDELFKEHNTILNSSGGTGSWAQTTNGGSDSDILPVGSNPRTVLSISICNQSTSVAIGFDIGYLTNDTSPHKYIYRHQSVPATGTFIHNSKLLVAANDNLQLRTPTSTANTDLGIVVSYVEQT